MWTLDGNQGRLSTPSFSAVVPLHEPVAGLQEVRFHGKRVAANKLLSVAPAENKPRAAALIDQYVRGDDLVATYDETAELPVKSQIYWRAFELEQPAPLVGVELILSMQTSLLDSNPQVAVASELPASEVIHLAENSPAEFVSCEVGRPAKIFDSATSTGLLLVRLSDSETTWIQMVHPKDFVTVEIGRGGPSGTVSVCHRLFSERLEKGVIRRGRLRGIMAARKDDTRIGLDCYRQFRSSLPPLTV